MTVSPSRKFLGHLQDRIKSNPKLYQQYRRRIDLFSKNPKSKHLKDHALVGKHTGKRSFSVNRNIRVIYYLKSSHHTVLLDIGTHSQVYGSK